MDKEISKELMRRKPGEGSHRPVVGASVVECKLSGEVLPGKETVGGVKASLVLAVAALDLSVVSWGIGTDELMPYAQILCGGFKQGGQVPPGVGEAVGELKAIVGLDTLHGDAPALKPFDRFYEEVGGGVSGLLLISAEEAQTGKLVEGGVLKQA